MIIKDVYGRVIYESKADTIREALEEAVRNEVPLYEAQLDGVCLDGACLDGAILEGASFQRSLLVDVSFHKAHLDEADFFLSNLSGASFKGAFLDEACFQNASLIGTVLDAEVPPLDDHRFISEILWRSAQKGPQKDFAARVRVETYKCWEHFYFLAREKKVLSWAKRVLSEWTIYKEQIRSIEKQIQSIERRLKNCR